VARPDDDDTKRDGEPSAELTTRSSPYPLSRLAPPYKLVDIAREIEKADQMVATVVSGKLELLAEQIRTLQARAREIMAAAELDSKLHRARCNFQKHPGAVYHLYEGREGNLYFSMLSPADWQGSPPDPFHGSYRLELDASFTRVDEPE
jgi:hypothetical protein